MDYRTAVNGKKQHSSNHENYRQERNPAPPESKEQNKKKSVEQAGNKASHFTTNPSSHDAHCSSTNLQERDIETQQNFYKIIHQSTLMEIKRKADRDNRGNKKYNGIYHSQYALSVRNFTLFNQKEPLNMGQLNQLLPLLDNHYPTSCWTWRNLATPFHAWATAGLFTSNMDLYQEAQNVQKNLLNAFLDQVLKRHEKNRILPGLNARSLASMLKPLAQPMNLETQDLKKPVSILLQHVETIDESPNGGFMEKSALSLLWSTVQLVEQGLKPEKTPELKSSVAILWKSATQQDSMTYQGLGNLIRCIAQLAKCRLLKDTLEFNQSVTFLLLIVDQKKEQLPLQAQSNILWSIGELVDLRDGIIHLLNPENTQKIQDITFTLSHKIETDLKSKENHNLYDAQYIVSTLRTITTLVKCGLIEGMSKDKSELSQSLAVLYPLTAKMKYLFIPKELGYIMVAIAELGKYELTPKNTQLFENTAVALLPLVQTTAQSKKGFSPLDIVNAMSSIASLAENKLLKVTLTLNQSVATLLSLVAKHEERFTPKNLVNLLEALSKLYDGEMTLKNRDLLKATALTLLSLLETKATLKGPFKIKQIAKILCSVAKLMDNGLELDTQKFSPLVTLMLPLIVEQKDHITASNIRTLLWAMAALMKFIPDWKNLLDFQVAAVSLLSIVATKVELKEERKRLTIPLLLWDIATLVSQGLKLKTPALKELVAKLLCHIDVLNNPLIPQYVANILWAVALLGELIEIKVAVTLCASLIDLIKTYDNFTQSEMMTSLWGMVACIARAKLFSSDCAAECAILQTHIQQLFNHLKNSTLKIAHDKTTIALASAWLGEPCALSPSYEIRTSEYQIALHQALSKTCPSLSIEKERVLGALPPVDIYLPDHKIAIEVQGPYHYIGDDLQTKNGSTLLKIVLLKKLRCDVIEIPNGSPYDRIAIQKHVEKIQERIQIAEEALDDKYFTAEKTINSSETLSLEATETSTKTEQQATEVLTRKKKKKKKKDRRNKTPQSLLPHSL